MSDDEYDDTTDEKFDRWLREAARDYHRPPAAVPRDEMWSAIAAARATAAAVSPGAGASSAVSSSRWSPRLWQMAAAAVLLLGAGIGIGRGLRSDAGAPSASMSGSPSVASADSALPPVPVGELAAGSEATGGRRAPGPRPATGASVASDASYAVITVDHLARAEALLTSFKGAHGDSADASLGKWARELLSDTRLLLDSPAAGDSRRRHLLEDLELVLAQIVQLRAESSADRNLVRRSIERGEVLTRIRSTIPAGQSAGV